MFPQKSRKFTLTLICYVALALLMTEMTQAKDYAERRDHAALNRMIRKRVPTVGDLSNRAVSSPQAAPPSSTDSSVLSSSQITPSRSASIPSSPVASPSPTPSDPLSGLISALTGGAPSASSSSVSSSSSSMSSLSSSSLPSSSSSSPLPPTSTLSTPSTFLTPGTASSSTVVQTLTSVAPSNTGTVSGAGSSGSSSSGHTTLIAIIAVASAVAAIAIIWTLIRKWKFRPSSQFEDRMQPIDWQPSGPESEPHLHRSASAMSHGSFHSSSAYNDAGAHLEDRTNPIPDHDFTAGPAQLAPVGGYADLARGPSPQPQQMQEALTRGPSMVRQGYDQYGVPLHHQGGYDVYGGVARPGY